MVALAALLVIHLVGNVSVRNAVVAGLAIGVATLTHASTLLFAPVAGLMVLGFSRRLETRTNLWLPALLVVLSATLVVSPWSIRNYRVFGSVVPIRTDLGHMAYIGNVALAQTYLEHRSDETVQVKIPWKSQGHRPCDWQSTCTSSAAVSSQASALREEM